MDIYDSPMHDENDLRRSLNDYLPRKCLKDMYENRAISLENPESINSFSDTFYEEETFVVEHLRNLQDIHCGKEMRTKVAQERKRNLQEKIYADFPCKEIIQDGNQL